MFQWIQKKSTIIMASLGVVVIIASIFYGIHVKDGIAESVNIEGKVTGMKSSFNYNRKNTDDAVVNKRVSVKFKIETGVTFSDPDYIYYPVITFIYNNKKIEFTSSKGNTPSDYRLNDKVNVLYNANTNTQIVDEGILNYATPFSLLVVGIILLFMGVFGKDNDDDEHSDKIYGHDNNS